MSKFWATPVDDTEWFEEDREPYWEEDEWQRHMGWDAEPGDPYFDWSSLSSEDLERMTFGGVVLCCAQCGEPAATCRCTCSEDE